ncbi:DUF6188 family protein [Streptomyces caeruleatus]|uniref:DUF6188 family protein n=1 Tax=Streptomyces caeruleatus TaxID=661399 RepID=UPI000A61E17E
MNPCQEFRPDPSSWILGLRGLPVTAVRHTGDPPRRVLALAAGAELTFDAAADLTHGSASAPGAVSVPAEQWAELVGATVLSAVAFTSGGLRVVFDSGHHLNVRGGDPELVVRVRKPGDFDWAYRGGIGVMTHHGADGP